MFLKRTTFSEGTKCFVKKVSLRKKNKLDERNGPFREMKNDHFWKKNEKTKLKKNFVFLLNERIFQMILKKTIVFYWTNDIFWTNDKIENERNQCFWTIDKNGSFTKAKRTKWKSRTVEQWEPSLFVVWEYYKNCIF